MLACVQLTAVAQPQGGRCEPLERTLWWCRAGARKYALCASADLGPGAGYLQYRARRAGKLELTVPAERRHPRGLFELQLAARGASLSFQNGGYTYAIYEPLAGTTTIDVIQGDRALASVSCKQASDTLTLTEVQSLLRSAGVFP